MIVERHTEQLEMNLAGDVKSINVLMYMYCTKLLSTIDYFASSRKLDHKLWPFILFLVCIFVSVIDLLGAVYSTAYHQMAWKTNSILSETEKERER